MDTQSAGSEACQSLKAPEQLASLMTGQVFHYFFTWSG